MKQGTDRADPRDTGIVVRATAHRQKTAESFLRKVGETPEYLPVLLRGPASPSETASAVQAPRLMSPDNLRNEITRQWALVDTRRTTIYAMHPDKLNGFLASISLHEHGGARAWLHFRTDGKRVQCARAQDAEAPDLLEWGEVEVATLDTILRGFLQKFERPWSEWQGFTPYRNHEDSR